MPARFHARGSLHLSARRLFVVYGDVLEGAVRTGMRLSVPLNSALSLEAPIASVELVHGTPTGSHVALAIALEDPTDLDVWKGLNLGDEILSVGDPNSDAA